jgi:hypothetical protein
LRFFLGSSLLSGFLGGLASHFLHGLLACERLPRRFLGHYRIANRLKGYKKTSVSVRAAPHAIKYKMLYLPEALAVAQMAEEEGIE